MSSPVLHSQNPTHYANLMMKYMIARSVQLRHPELVLSNFSMPMWHIDLPPIAETPGQRTALIQSAQAFNFTRLSYLLERGLFDRYNWDGYGQRMENFPPVAECRAMFQRPDEAGLGTGDDVMVCPVRGGEILDARHPGYTIIPVDFYADIAEETGLQMVFMGQTEDTPYMAAMRARLPHAEYLPSMGPLRDFQTIRRARNIVLPVSTFAWLAAWLSHATLIVCPVFGMFNPKLFPHHDLLPIGEARYRFYQFPEQPAVALDQLLDAHAAINGQWHRTDVAALTRF